MTPSRIQPIGAFLKSYFGQFHFFYQQLGYRLFLVLVAGMLMALLDGLGLAMFLPLLQMVSDQGGTAVASDMGGMGFILQAITALGLPLTLTVILLVMLLFFTIKGGFSYLANYLNVVNQQYFIRKLRIENIEALSAYRFDLFVTADAGRIQNVLTGEVERVSRAFANYMQILLQSMMVLVYAGLAVLSNPSFALLVAIGGGLTNLIFRRLYRETKSLSTKLSLAYSEFQGLLIQQVAFFKYLKAAGLIRKYGDRMKHEVRNIEYIQHRIGVLSSAMSGLREPILIGVIVVVILFQVNVFGGNLGLIILSILFFYRALTAVMQVQYSHNNFLSLTGSMDSTRNLLQEFHSSSDPKETFPYKGFHHDLHLDQVSFAYPSGPEVLSGISLCLNKNETLALVGESGAGKTTLMNLFSGLLTPTSGQIWIDDQKVSGLNMPSFHDRIGYITQEPVIFDDTIFNNVTFWAEKNEATLHRFWEALDKACMDEFVRDCPDREESRLGNNGINLSGGQKQRISIARELYKEVDFLFLDEATSALDSGTERAIHDNLSMLHGKVTIVIIAHRLSTIKSADRLVLMNRGRIVQVGSYSELADRSDLFQRMVELQEL